MDDCQYCGGEVDSWDWIRTDKFKGHYSCYQKWKRENSLSIGISIDYCVNYEEAK